MRSKRQRKRAVGWKPASQKHTENPPGVSAGNQQIANLQIADERWLSVSHSGWPRYKPMRWHVSKERRAELGGTAIPFAPERGGFLFGRKGVIAVPGKTTDETDTASRSRVMCAARATSPNPDSAFGILNSAFRKGGHHGREI